MRQNKIHRILAIKGVEFLDDHLEGFKSPFRSMMLPRVDDADCYTPRPGLLLIRSEFANLDLVSSGVHAGCPRDCDRCGLDHRGVL